MWKKSLAIVLVASTVLNACATQQQNEELGNVFGGIIGGFLGSQFGEGSGKVAASIGGALVGAWVGKQVVRGLSKEDRMYYDRAADRAEEAEIGETVVWNNPETGNSGTITPTREGQTDAGEYCREYQQTVTIDGQTERAYGTACRQPDGSWRIV
jgi:surface antigen